MCGGKAKQLRMIAYELATSPEKKNIKIRIGGQLIWKKGTPKQIYRSLKRA